MERPNRDASLCDTDQHDRTNEYDEIWHERQTAFEDGDSLHASEGAHGQEHKSDHEQDSTEETERHPTTYTPERSHGLLANVSTNKVHDITKRRRRISGGHGTHPFIQPAKSS
jgi:TATA-binding protein-associated factor Taf7